MNSKSAIKALKDAGYSARNGKGDHVVLRKETRVIIIPNGKPELSSGMTAKVRSHLNRGESC